MPSVWSHLQGVWGGNGWRETAGRQPPDSPLFPACDRRATVRRYTTVGAPSRPLGNSTCFACRFNLFSLAKQVELPSEINCFARENNLFPQGAVTDKRVVRPYARWVNKATYRQFGEPSEWRRVLAAPSSSSQSYREAFSKLYVWYYIILSSILSER